MILANFNSLPFNAGCWLTGNAGFGIVLDLPLDPVESIPLERDAFGLGVSAALVGDLFGMAGEALPLARDAFGVGHTTVKGSRHAQ